MRWLAISLFEVFVALFSISQVFKLHLHVMKLAFRMIFYI